MSAPPLPGDPSALPLAAFALSHPGRQRPDNEDAFGNFVDGRLFVIADGMGGHNAGAVASAMAVDSIETFFRSYHAEPHQVWPYPVDRSLSLAANLLRVGIKVANDKIREAAAADRARARMARSSSRSRTRATAAPTGSGGAASRASRAITRWPRR
jgi:serine/threonine protein phosphatase PrpC